MTNEQLVIRIKAGENVADNMEQLYKQVCRFIHSIAWQFRGQEEIEDLEQEGYLALYPAIDGYDPDHGVKFLTYAEFHIRQRMRRYIQMKGSRMRLPVRCRELMGKYDRLCSSFMAEHGRKPTDREAADFMGLTLDQIEDIRENACMARLGSLDALVVGIDGGEDTTMGDLVAAPGSLEDDAIERIQSDRLKTALWGCVDALPDRQAEVIRQRYQDGVTLAEIGRRQETTPEAVRQIHAKALRELRKPKYSKRFRPFLNDARIYSMALVGSGADRFNQTWTSSTERVAFKVMDWDERRRERLELMEKVRQSVATSQQNSTVLVPIEQ